jgi:hypothetical protein
MVADGKAFLELLAVLLAVVTLQYDQDHQLCLAFIFNLSHSQANSAKYLCRSD